MGAVLASSFAGDVYRVLFGDGDGVVRDGDDLLFVLASDWKASGRLHGPVVGTLMSNFGFERALGEAGIGFIRAKVGDRYVHKAPLEHGSNLGGERTDERRVGKECVSTGRYRRLLAHLQTNNYKSYRDTILFFLNVILPY